MTSAGRGLSARDVGIVNFLLTVEEAQAGFSCRRAAAPCAKMACAGRWSRRMWDLLSSSAQDARR